MIYIFQNVLKSVVFQKDNTKFGHLLEINPSKKHDIDQSHIF